jgi:osmotically-inducible protein OsmY
MNKTSYLEGRVLAELHDEPSLRDDHIRVTAKDGVILLSGSVRSASEKDAAERAAIRVTGVRGVVQELGIDSSDHQRSADELLAENATRQLAVNRSIPKDAVKVEVDNGCVTLLGRVSREFQRAAAERLIRGLSGAVSVTNHIVVGRDAMAGL